MTLTDSEMLAIFDKEVRRECDWTRMRREGMPYLVRYTKTGIGVGGGFISWSDLTSESADAAIERQLAHYQTLGLDFEWKLYSHDQPADLGARLTARGFKAGEPEALMVADISELPAELWMVDVSAVSRVTTPEGVDAIVRMENEVWGKELSGIGEGLKFDLKNFAGFLSVFAVWKDERVVSAAWTHFLKPTSFASLGGGSTLVEHREKGYYTMLLAFRAREARDRGYHFLTVDASPDSQPILAKNGFKCLAYSTPYDWKPGSTESGE